MGSDRKPTIFVIVWWRDLHNNMYNCCRKEFWMWNKWGVQITGKRSIITIILKLARFWDSSVSRTSSYLVWSRWVFIRDVESGCQFNLPCQLEHDRVNNGVVLLGAPELLVLHFPHILLFIQVKFNILNPRQNSYKIVYTSVSQLLLWDCKWSTKKE